MSHSRSTRAALSAGLLCALAGARMLGSAPPSQQASAASVSGVVLAVCSPDAIPGVRVTLSNDAGRQLVITDADGRFSFGETTVGPYVLTSELSGFLTVTRTVAVTERTPEIQIEMEVGSYLDHPQIIQLPGDVYRRADALVRLVVRRTGEQLTVAGAPIIVLDATVLDVFKAPASGRVAPGRPDPPPSIEAVAAGDSVPVLLWARGPSSPRSQDWLVAYATGDELVALLRWTTWCRREEGWTLESAYPVRDGLVSVRSNSADWRALDGLAPAAFAEALERLAREP